MRFTQIILAYSIAIMVILTNGCGSSLKRELATAQLSIRQLQQQRSALEHQIQETTKSLRNAERQVSRLTSQLETTRQESRADLKGTKRTLTRCEANLKACEARRVYLESTNVGVLDSRLRECIESRPKYVEHGFAQGRLAVLESLSIIGKPRSDCGVFFCDYYYSVEVKLKDHTFFLTEVETESEETGLFKSLTGISDLVNIAKDLIQPLP